MFSKSKVFFKGKGNGLIIVLDENTEYEELKAELINKVKRSKTFFKGASEDIVFQGKELTSEQQDEISDIIIKNAALEIGFINSGSDGNFAFKRRKETRPEPELTHKSEDCCGTLSESGSSHKLESLLGNDEKVLFYNGFVRSGTLVESDGHVVIIGGVNPGGEVFAGKNVVVFGQLKGRAIAGRNGDTSCIIAAILMEPELLGIAGLVTRFPSAKKEKLHKSPSIARLENNKIIISPSGNFGIGK